MKKLNIGVFIGRFQPLHNAHLSAIKLALSEMDRLVIVLGSDCTASTVKNPWNSEKRTKMIRESLSDSDNNKICIVSIKDYLYNDNIWLSHLQSSLSNLKFSKKETIDAYDNNITLYGHDKDRSTFYLHLFPQWEFRETGDLGEVNATKIRDFFFNEDLFSIINLVPNSVFNQLNEDIKTEEFKRLLNEYLHIKKYKELWSNSPFPPVFVTTDAVVIKSGHVLVVKRKGYPGKGLLALPGGFLNPTEQIITGCIRELKEETVINLPKDELKKRIVDSYVFDHPDRSLRGRTITHAFCFNLGSGSLPKVKGSDDAEHAFWMPLRDVLRREEEFFEDHFYIINYFCNRF